MRDFFKAATLGLAITLPTAGGAQDNTITPDPHPHNEIVDTVYLDPYREPELGSSYSEFVFALMTMDRICWSEYALEAHDNLNALCGILETVLYEGFEDGAPENMIFDPRYIYDLPIDLPETTADAAAGFVAQALPHFNQFAQDARIMCPDGVIGQCYEFIVEPSQAYKLIIPTPPA